MIGKALRSIFTGVLLLFVCYASHAQSGNFHAIDVRGIAVHLNAAPRRIVSLNPGTTEVLFALGLKGRVVGVTTYCNFPKDALSVAKIGDVNTSIEKVVALSPDLIVASVSANRAAIEQLERLHHPVFCVDPKNILEMCKSMEELGKLTDSSKKAREVITSVYGYLQKNATVIKHTANRPKVLVIVQIEPLMIVGPNNFMDDLIVSAGAVNLGRTIDKEWGTIPAEKVVALQPDIIVASKSDFERIKNRPGWSSIPAIRNNQLVPSAGDIAVRPGPRLIEALAYFTRQFHPEIPPVRP